MLPLLQAAFAATEANGVISRLAKAAPVVAAAGGRAMQSYNDSNGTSVWRYTNTQVFIDRYFGGEWHTYGPYPKR